MKAQTSTISSLSKTTCGSSIRTKIAMQGRQIYKWKNHFSEMKGDVGMSVHEKEGEQEDA